MDSKYHLFKRKMLSLDGKEYSVWYYYYWQNGKRIRRPAGHGCRLKREAQRYVEELERKDALRAQSPEQQPIVREPITVSKTIKMPSYRTFGELAETMFLPDSLHLRRQLLADGRGIKEATRLAHRGVSRTTFFRNGVMLHSSALRTRDSRTIFRTGLSSSSKPRGQRLPHLWSRSRTA